jgi:hypothetical protein
VRQLDNGKVEVAIIDPLMMMSVVENKELKPVADEARARLERVAQSLQAQADQQKGFFAF